MYLYSNIIGTFVFSQNFDIRERHIFTEKESLLAFPLLLEGKPLDSENKFLKKYKKIQNLRETKDEAKIIRALDALIVYKDELRSLNLNLTKNQISDSVRDDSLIIQTSNLLNELNKTINMLSKRFREWYSYSLPELEEKIHDHSHLMELVLQKSRAELIKEFNIKNSMGTSLKKEDYDSILSLAKTINALHKEKQNKETYLESLMKRTCPNLNAVAGFLIGASLVSIAGSLRNMVLMPASTIQILGAEKALFRHMVTGARPPRHGIIVNHPLISGKPQAEHGKRARALADKISMAVKIDFFKGKYIGDKLKKELDEKFK